MDELEQKQTGLQLITQSKELYVVNEHSYSNAVEVCKDIKIKISAIEKYWEPLKTSAFQAHKNICAKEKELLKPYTDAETGIKNKMVAYQKQLAEEARILSEDQERFRKEEEARLLALAVKAEAEGKEEHSEYLIEQAQEIHVAKFKQPEPVKVVGSAVKKIWKARIVNQSIVPCELNGFMIRPIDEGVLRKIAIGTKGNMAVPGVEFYEDIDISVSRG